MTSVCVRPLTGRRWFGYGATTMVPLLSVARSTITWLVMVAVSGSVLAGCASTASAPPVPSPPRASVGALDGIRRVVVVTSGESQFTVDPSSREPGQEFESVMKWLPYKEILVPVARAVYWGITWLIDDARKSSTMPGDVTPAAVVTEAFARTIVGRGPFATIATLEREPVGDVRRNADAIVRVTVPSWGLVRVRDGGPGLAAAFADVRAQIVLRESGIVVWEHEEDVTSPGRLPVDSLMSDRALTREELVDVLERAGRRLATELLYAQGQTR